MGFDLPLGDAMSARFVVEFVVDDPESFRPKYEGDAAIDYFDRAFDRVLRDHLNAARKNEPRILSWYRIVREEKEVEA